MLRRLLIGLTIITTGYTAFSCEASRRPEHSQVFPFLSHQARQLEENPLSKNRKIFDEAMQSYKRAQYQKVVTSLKTFFDSENNQATKKGENFRARIKENLGIDDRAKTKSIIIYAASLAAVDRRQLQLSLDVIRQLFHIEQIKKEEVEIEVPGKEPGSIRPINEYTNTTDDWNAIAIFTYGSILKSLVNDSYEPEQQEFAQEGTEVLLPLFLGNSKKFLNFLHPTQKNETLASFLSFLKISKTKYYSHCLKYFVTTEEGKALFHNLTPLELAYWLVQYADLSHDKASEEVEALSYLLEKNDEIGTSIAVRNGEAGTMKEAIFRYYIALIDYNTKHENFPLIPEIFRQYIKDKCEKEMISFEANLFAKILREEQIACGLEQTIEKTKSTDLRDTSASEQLLQAMAPAFDQSNGNLIVNLPSKIAINAKLCYVTLLYEFAGRPFEMISEKQEANARLAINVITPILDIRNMKDLTQKQQGIALFISLQLLQILKDPNYKKYANTLINELHQERMSLLTPFQQSRVRINFAKYLQSAHEYHSAFAVLDFFVKTQRGRVLLAMRKDKDNILALRYEMKAAAAETEWFIYHALKPKTNIITCHATRVVEIDDDSSDEDNY